MGSVVNFIFITLFPEIIKASLNESITKKAIDNSLITCQVYDPKNYLNERERIDDKIYGGGPGMLLKPEPLKKVLDKVLEKLDKGLDRSRIPPLYFKNFLFGFIIAVSQV